VRLPRKWHVKEHLTDLYGFTPLEHVIVVGTTLSGPNTVIRLLSNLPPTLPAAFVVMQEISPRIISSFVKEFDEHVPWRVEEAQNGTVVAQGTCYLCSNEQALMVKQNHKGEACLISGGALERPLNLLFSSAANVFHQNTIGVLLLGPGDDGTEGLASIKKELGVTMVQDTRCCVYPNLTHHAILQGVVDMVLDETRLPGAIESVIAP